MDPAEEEVWLGPAALRLTLAVRSTGSTSSAYNALAVTKSRL